MDAIPGSFTVLSQPRTWVITEGRAGDDSQILALASALGWPYQRLELHSSIPQILLDRAMDACGFKLRPSLLLPSGLSWPDVLIAAGGRSVSLARRVKHASGGRTKLVFIGRPWSRLDVFDLIVTTPQYRLPPLPNVMTNLLPLNGIDRRQLEPAAQRWRPHFAHLPRPWIGVLVGGNSGSFRMTRHCIRTLAASASRMAAAQGGSLLMTTSSRTPAEHVDALFDAIDVPAYCHRWRPNDPDNPYIGLLALADSFLVTGESASLIAEAIDTGKPVDIFPMRQRLLSRLLTARLPGMPGPGSDRAPPPWLSWPVARGLWTPARDLHRFHSALRRAGLMNDGQAARQSAIRPIEAELSRVVERIRSLPNNQDPRPLPAIYTLDEALA